MPDFDTMKISGLTAIPAGGIQDADRIEVSEPDQNGTVWTSKSLTLGAIKRAILDSIYPVGSIYISTTISTANAMQSTFGGTWQAYAQGRVIFGKADDYRSPFYKIDSTGGSESITITSDNLPSHNHLVEVSTKYDVGYVQLVTRHPYSNETGDDAVTPSVKAGTSGNPVAVLSNGGDKSWSNGTVTKAVKEGSSKKGDKLTINMPGLSTTVKINNFGNGNPITGDAALPPYVVCYIYKRTG